LNEEESENNALKRRLKYEIKHAVFSGNFIEAKLFLNLYKELCKLLLILRFLSLLSKWEIDLSLLRIIYLKMVH